MCIGDWVYTLPFRIYDFGHFGWMVYTGVFVLKYPERVLLKLPLGTLGRIDALGGNRSEFIRGAVEAALGGGGMPVSAVKPEPVRCEKKFDVARSEVSFSDRREADVLALLEVIGGGRFTCRQVEGKMDWAGLRYSNAEKALLSSGRAAVIDGVLVAT